MKRFLLSVCVVMMFAVAPSSAIEELDEKLSKHDWEIFYAPPKEAAKKARDAGDFLKAAPLFLEAGNAHAMTYVRSLQKLNEGYCYLREADDVKDKELTVRAIEAYQAGLVLMDKADKICKKECVHEADGVKNCSDTRRIVRGKLERSLKTAKDFLAVLNK